MKKKHKKTLVSTSNEKVKPEKEPYLIGNVQGTCEILLFFQIFHLMGKSIIYFQNLQKQFDYVMFILSDGDLLFIIAH